MTCNASGRGAWRTSGTGTGAGAATIICGGGDASAGRAMASIGAVRCFALGRFAGIGVGSAAGVAPVRSGARVSPTFLGDRPAGTTDTGLGNAAWVGDAACSVIWGAPASRDFWTCRATKAPINTTATRPAARKIRSMRRDAETAGSAAGGLTKRERSAARRAVAATDWLGRSRLAPERRLPAASSSGCVTVAANARLRAELQSEHSFAPGRLVRPQIRHFIMVFLPAPLLAGHGRLTHPYDKGILTPSGMGAPPPASAG